MNSLKQLNSSKKELEENYTSISKQLKARISELDELKERYDKEMENLIRSSVRKSGESRTRSVTKM